MTPLTQDDLNKLMQRATLAALGIAIDAAAWSKVRVGWQEQGQPFHNISEDVCYLTTTEDDDDYNRQRDEEIEQLDDASVTTTTTYVRVWKTHWIFYGPNASDRARKLKSALLKPVTHDILAASNVYVITDLPATSRQPEEHDGQWWERVDFEARFNEGVSESETVPTAASVEVVTQDKNGVLTDGTFVLSPEN